MTKLQNVVRVSPMMLMDKVHDVSIYLRIVFVANHNAKGFDKGGGDTQTSRLLHVDELSKSIDYFAGKFGDVMLNIGVRNSRRC